MSQSIPPVQQAPNPLGQPDGRQQAFAQLQAYEASAVKGARWFYWIAGLSAINMVMTLTGSGLYFVIGLGIPLLVTLMLTNMGSAGTAAAIGVNVVVLGMFFVFGRIACTGRIWALIVGTVLYLLDGLIFLFIGDWLSVGFHAFVLIGLFSGMRAMARADRLKAQLAQLPQMAPIQPPPQYQPQAQENQKP